PLSPTRSPPFPYTTLFRSLDAARRSPYLTLELCNDEKGPGLNLRMPRGREGMHVVSTAHAHPVGQPGALPLLEPKGTLYTTSFLDRKSTRLNSSHLGISYA